MTLSYGDHPNGMGYPVDPRLQWLEDIEAELVERFERLDRLADFTPADINLMVIDVLVATSSPCAAPGEVPPPGPAGRAPIPRVPARQQLESEES